MIKYIHSIPVLGEFVIKEIIRFYEVAEVPEWLQ